MILTREQAIDKLIEHDMQLIKDESKNWEEQSETLRKILFQGFMGYATAWSNISLETLIKKRCKQEIKII